MKIGSGTVLKTKPTKNLTSVRVPTHPGKFWDFFLKFPVPEKSWEIRLVLESPGN